MLLKLVCFLLLIYSSFAWINAAANIGMACSINMGNCVRIGENAWEAAQKAGQIYHKYAQAEEARRQEERIKNAEASKIVNEWGTNNPLDWCIGDTPKETRSVRLRVHVGIEKTEVILQNCKMKEVKELEFPVHKYGELSQPLPEEVRLDIVGNIGNQSKLFWILCRYDFAHAPSNWNPEYKHEKTILQFEQYILEKKPRLARKIVRLVEGKSEADLTESVSQGGELSELLFDVMIDFYG